MDDHELHGRIADALVGVGHPALRHAMSEAVALAPSRRDLARIERSFDAVTASPPGAEALRWFFRSWMMTNNSAMCVSGLGNRISLQLRDRPDPSLVEALVSLHRIADEDLGVGDGLLHAELFYAMATTLCGGDEWQSRTYLTPEAAEFKAWKDRCSLIDDDLVIGLLSTVVHEVYTHAEVELIHPLFDGWLAGHGWSATDRERALRWVTVHCGATELDHFGHAVDALVAYSGGDDRVIGLVEPIVLAYLDRKAAAMASIEEQLGPIATFATAG